MAVSLLCKDCNSLLKNVAEAQAHSDATGHVNFEESTQPVTQLVCVACGKPCRTDAEKTLHTKFTGHTEFEDRTGQALAVLDTEAEVAAARQAMEEDLDADAELLGLKRKKKPAGDAAAGTGAAGGGGPEGGGAEAGGAEAGAGASAAAGDDELVPVEVKPELLAELLGMGFSEARAARGLHFSGNSTLEGAINWLAEHEAEPELDTPLLVPKSTVKHQLSAEEAKAQAAELMRKAKLRREREEAEAARVRERERIRAGKELLEAKRKEEDGAMRRLVEERRREKEEEARAREKLRAKLEEDRKERRRKLGLPEESTEEEKAREAERARKRAEEEAGKRHVYVKPISVLEKLRPALVAMKKAGGDEGFKAAAGTLLKYLGNVARAPDEAKFRTINTANAAFAARVAAVPGAVDFLKVVGFAEEGGALVLARDKVDLEVLNAAGAEINSALSNPYFGML
ncbi:ubxn1 [Scenedesmus sp. PABB004]|nr:ubxn1 [Scenedesmus sp. PABB004]